MKELEKECIIEIRDNREARHIYDRLEFYSKMNGCKDIERKDEDYITSYTAGEGNHSWEEKTFTSEELKDIKIKLHLETPHNENDRLIINTETLDIIIFKENGTLEEQEIKSSIDLIEALTGTKNIRKFIANK